MGLGFKSYSQAGKETTWAGGATATEKVEFTADTLELMPNVFNDPSLYTGRSHRIIMDGPMKCTGNQTHRANYTGFLERLRAAFGGYSQSSPESGVHKHTFIEGDQPSLYLETSKGDVPTGKIFAAIGAKVTSFTFECSNAAPSTFDFGYIARDLQPDTDPSASLSFPSVLPIEPNSQVVSFTDGTADVTPRFRRFKMTYNCPMDEGDDAANDVNIGEPLPSDHVVAEFEIEQYFATDSAYNIARNMTSGAIDLYLRHPTLIGSTKKREFHINAPTCRLVKLSLPVQGYGRIWATATWRAYYNSGIGSSVKLDVQNEQAALS